MPAGPEAGPAPWASWSQGPCHELPFVYTLFHLVCHLKLKKKKMTNTLTLKWEVKIEFYIGRIEKGVLDSCWSGPCWDVRLKMS